MQHDQVGSESLSDVCTREMWDLCVLAEQANSYKEKLEQQEAAMGAPFEQQHNPPLMTKRPIGRIGGPPHLQHREPRGRAAEVRRAQVPVRSQEDEAAGDPLQQP